MQASTSRLPARLASHLGTAGFSTSAVSSLSRRQVIVELLEDVEGLGKAFDRVLVAPGRARNSLVPYRRARFIPFAKGVDRSVSRQPTFTEGAQITPGFRIEGPGRPTLSREDKLPKDTPQTLLNALFALPSSLIFPLRTIDAESSTLHGSLTLDDVHNRLEKDYELSRSAVTVAWDGEEGTERIKELGTRGAVVKVNEAGREEMLLDIEVVRLDEAGHGN